MKLTRDDDRRAPDKGPSMTPMIDVTFQLLIFFMCTLEFKTLDAKLGAYLPKDAGAGSGEPVERIHVQVDVVVEGTRISAVGADQADGWDGTGAFTYADDRVLRYTIGPRAYASLDAARERLAELHELAPERDVTIDALPGTVYGDVVPVLDACVLTGFTDVAFSGAR